jgi:putative glutathione S-transferase
MGILADGKWHNRGYDTESYGGKFKREQSSFRNWITADGSSGLGGTGGFRAELGR